MRGAIGHALRDEGHNRSRENMMREAIREALRDEGRNQARGRDEGRHPHAVRSGSKVIRRNQIAIKSYLDETACTETSPAPADWPAIVMVVGSPPKAAACWRRKRNPSRWSCRP